ncbi:MAG: glycosyltransferase family 1 protein [Bacteroidetes bacterium HGW-Bacteroidetes-4]|jgi:glycosyltransferase involved in cell wall biosynthesis|nr:MAG: glycosyltransferase family 1 protein [Bacteroidetes bacterium HGW-Bacteroidetes-4]
MKIAVNTQHLLKDRLEGLGRFTFETLKRITRQHPEHQFVFIFDRPWNEQFIFSDNIIPIKTLIPSRHPLLWYLRFEQAIPVLLKKHKADLFLSTDGWSTLNTKVKRYTVIHDLDFVHHPENFSWLKQKYFNTYFPKFARRATRLGTVSEYSRNDMVKTWNLSANSIDVIYNGSNALYKPVAPEVAEQARKEFTQGKPYFIYVGSLNPRKNIEGMMQSFDAFKQQSGLTHQLVIVGEKMWGNSEIENVYENMLHKNDVLFTGRLSDEKLHILLASAHALVLVSHLEGFGIPLLEAMCCDVPVLCSNVTALPEVAGNAGHLVNPNSVDSIAQGFAKLAGDENYRQSLISNARIQRVKFNWDQSAERLWNGIEKCF